MIMILKMRTSITDNVQLVSGRGSKYQYQDMIVNSSLVLSGDLLMVKMRFVVKISKLAIVVKLAL